MRLISLIPAAFILLMSGPAYAQDWIEYASRADFFSINMPAQPKLQDITFTSEHGAVLPARVHSAEEGPDRYSVTVVDYNQAQRIHAERAKACPPDAQSACVGSEADDAAQGVGSWKYDMRGATDFASWKFLLRDAKLTYFGWAVIDRIEGRYIQLTNANGSRTFVGIYMHENRLYISEATVPKGAPEPGLFQQSMRFLDKDGRGIRYESIYTNGFPVPARAGGGAGGRGGGRGGQ